MKLRLAILFLLVAVGAYGQSTTVSGTITDAGAQAWNNGTYSFVFKPAPSNPTAQYYWNGAPFSSSQTIQGNLNASAVFSVSVPSSTSITPSGSTWVFTVCPAATATNGCYTIPLTITGGTQSLSSLTPPAVVVNLTTAPVGSTAYTDSEVTGARTGQQYFNLSDSTIHACTGFPPCTWISVGATTSILPSNNTFTGSNTFTQTINGSISGNAATAGALAALPSQCGGIQFSIGIAANGNANCNNILPADVPPISLAGSGNGGVSGALPVAQIAPGSNGQCVNTIAGVTVWGACVVGSTVLAGTPNTTSVTVNGNTSGYQTLQIVCASSPCFSAGSLNSLTKTIDISAQGTASFVNTTEFVQISLNIGAGFGTFDSFTPSSTGNANWYLTANCTVTTAGASGSLLCAYQVTWNDAAGKSFANSNSVFLGANLTGTLSPVVGISFGTASTTNVGTSAYALAHLQN